MFTKKEVKTDKKKKKTEKHRNKTALIRFPYEKS